MTRIAHLLIWASLLTALLIPLGAHAVKKENLYLFSAVKGRIVNNGEPVVGLKVERSTFWNMEKEPRLETTYTDEKGFYSFPEMTGSAEFGFLAKLFHVPTITQQLRVYEGNEEFNIYVNIRNSYENLQQNSAENEIRILSDLAQKKLVVDNEYNVRSSILSSNQEF